MNARNFSWNASKRSATGSARFGIPCFKLAWRAAQPEKNAVLLGFLGFRREDRIVKKAFKTGDGGQRTAGQSFQEKTPVELMFVGQALTSDGL